jgi:hypothetical protein
MPQDVPAISMVARHTSDGSMKGLRRVRPLLAHHPALARLILAALPLILAACTYGGGSGGY